MNDTHTSKDLTTMLRSGRSSLMLDAAEAAADEIERLQQECVNWKQLRDADESTIRELERQYLEAVTTSSCLRKELQALRATPEPRAIAETSVGYRYIPANIATAVCDAAYKRASHTNKKAADALRPAMLAIIEAGIQVPGVRATQPPAPCAKPDAWLVVEPDGWRYLSAGEGDAMAHVAERGNGGTVYPLYRLAQPPELQRYRRALQHIANEPLTDDPEASAVKCLEEATRIAREALAVPNEVR